MFSTYVAAGAVLIALLALYIAAQAVSYARSCTQWIEENNKRSLGLKRLSELEAEMTELTESHAALVASIRKLRNRIGMRNLRKKRADGEPDPDQDPQAWKDYMMGRVPTTGAKEQ